MNLTFVDIVFALSFFLIGFLMSHTSIKSDKRSVELASLQTENLTIILLLGCLVSTLKKQKLKGVDVSSIEPTHVCKLVMDEYHTATANAKQDQSV